MEPHPSTSTSTMAKPKSTKIVSADEALALAAFRSSFVHGYHERMGETTTQQQRNAFEAWWPHNTPVCDIPGVTCKSTSYLPSRKLLSLLPHGHRTLPEADEEVDHFVQSLDWTSYGLPGTIPTSVGMVPGSRWTGRRTDYLGPFLPKLAT